MSLSCSSVISWTQEPLIQHKPGSKHKTLGRKSSGLSKTCFCRVMPFSEILRLSMTARQDLASCSWCEECAHLIHLYRYVQWDGRGSSQRIPHIHSESQGGLNLSPRLRTSTKKLKQSSSWLAAVSSEAAGRCLLKKEEGVTIKK